MQRWVGLGVITNDLLATNDLLVLARPGWTMTAQRDPARDRKASEVS